MNAAKALLARAPLGRWYANPLDRAEAKSLLTRTEARRARHRHHPIATACYRLQRLIALFWLEHDYGAEISALQRPVAYSARASIFTDLIYGQLLISRRLAGAFYYLDHAFENARLLFHPHDYFHVLNRHRLLHQLPLSPHAQAPAPLDELLRTAAVIEQLRRRHRASDICYHDATDIYG